ncbi:MAG: urate oxidase [Bryobacteraceae bacterium]
MANLTFDTYGKTRVRLTQVLRDNGAHEVLEISVRILFEGGFEKSYTAGDNSSILPTDTMKNTVYALARKRRIDSIEAFAGDLARHFLSHVPPLRKVKVEIEQTLWGRIGSYATAFLKNGEETRSAAVDADREREVYTSGISDLEILKTGNSGFADYIKDEYTTLPETHDRLLGTVLDAHWTYRSGAIDFNATHTAVRQTLLDSFAAHTSRSVQETLYAMAEQALATHAVLAEIHLVMPNKHRLLFDLSRFGLDNPNQIFVPTDEPSGYIEARIRASN